MIYDVIIIWAWAAWLFASINLPKNKSKLILEKNKEPWIKVLLSGWERANVSNIDIDPLRDYFGQNKKALLSIFSKYNQWDIQTFFAASWINIIEEDRWRLILESWNSKELLSLLLKKSRENNAELICDSEVLKLSKIWDLNKIKTKNNIYSSKNVIIASWWKSFFQVWTTWDSYDFADVFNINIITPYRWLCWLVTKKDFSSLSWSSLDLKLKIIDWENEIYQEIWPMLFTHYWISWPIVFNSAVALWEYLNAKKIYSEDEKINYIKDNITCEIEINQDKSTKKINKFFETEITNDEKIIFWLQDWRSWKEAKITWWWVDIDELDNNMQVKSTPWLYFIWESVDITWKTGWFNLQWAWSSAYVCWKSIK